MTPPFPGTSKEGQTAILQDNFLYCLFFPVSPFSRRGRMQAWRTVRHVLCMYPCVASKPCSSSLTGGRALLPGWEPDSWRGHLNIS